jgi:regulatory protein
VQVGLRTVSDIRHHARGSKRRTIWLDGEPWRPMAADVVRELGVRVGDEIDPALLEAQASEVEPRLARERSLRLLAYRERSEADLAGRLLDDGYPTDVVEQTVAALVGSGLVDDRRFAQVLARSLVEIRGFGRQRAMRELAAQGIEESLAVEALESLAPESGESARALQAAARLARAGDTSDRLAARLVRRGFAVGHALRAARETVVSNGDIDPD